MPSRPRTWQKTVPVKMDGSRSPDGPGRGRHRGDHLLHQHLQPLRDGRRRACWPAKPSRKGLQVKPYVKTSLAPGSRVVTEYLEKADLMQPLAQLGFRPGRLRLHDLHRQLGPAAPERIRGDHQRQPGRRGGAFRQPQFRGPDQPADPGQLPGLAPAGGRLCPGRDGGHRPG